MKLTAPLRGHEFGSLGVYVRGIVSFVVSPFHLKAFDNPIERAPQMLKRLLDGSIQTVPFALIGWYVHDYVEKKYDQMNRKDPKDYENDT